MIRGGERGLLLGVAVMPVKHTRLRDVGACPPQNV